MRKKRKKEKGEKGGKSGEKGGEERDKKENSVFKLITHLKSLPFKCHRQSYYHSESKGEKWKSGNLPFKSTYFFQIKQDTKVLSSCLILFSLV